MFITALFTITRTRKQPRCPSADEWVRKLWYIYTMEYYSAIKKNTFESVLMEWINWSLLYRVTQVKRKTPIKYTNAYIWNLERWQQWPYMWDSKRDTDVKNSLLDSMGEGEGGMIQEGSVKTCILSYVKQITNPGLMHETGCSGLVHWNDPGG